MKITSVETIYVKAPLPYATGPATWYYTDRDALLVKISTDEGLVGWGETAALAGVGTSSSARSRPPSSARTRATTALCGARCGA